MSRLNKDSRQLKRLVNSPNLVPINRRILKRFLIFWVLIGMSIAVIAGNGVLKQPVPAPEFTHTASTEWIGSPPLKLKDLRGNVLLIDFWTFDCWNCYRSFPRLNNMEARLAPKGLKVLSVHTPEFASVSIQHRKILNKKLYLQTVKKSSHLLMHPIINRLPDSLKFLVSKTRLRRHIEPHRNFIIVGTQNLAYLNIPKTAGTSIKKTMVKFFLSDRSLEQAEYEPYKDDYGFPKPVEAYMFRREKLALLQQQYFKFTFVRNPFSRLVSFYLDRIIKENEYYRIGKTEREFSKVAKIICKKPDVISDQHFVSQYFLVYEEGQCLVDFVGKFENLEVEFKPIQEKYDLSPLEHKRKAPTYDYRDYYTPELVEKVAKRYEKDIEVFGYQKDYEDLLAYVK